ncbi:MAG: hypothetical protein ACI376_03575 [Candidatus Bruticola sp.]
MHDNSNGAGGSLSVHTNKNLIIVYIINFIVRLAFLVDILAGIVAVVLMVLSLADKVHLSHVEIIYCGRALLYSGIAFVPLLIAYYLAALSLESTRSKANNLDSDEQLALALGISLPEIESQQDNRLADIELPTPTTPTSSHKEDNLKTNSTASIVFGVIFFMSGIYLASETGDLGTSSILLITGVGMWLYGMSGRRKVERMKAARQVEQTSASTSSQYEQPERLGRKRRNSENFAARNSRRAERSESVGCDNNYSDLDDQF